VVSLNLAHPVHPWFQQSITVLHDITKIPVLSYYNALIFVCFQQLCILAFATVEIHEPRSTDGHTKNDDTNSLD